MSATADEETRVFTLRRGGLVIAVNFGTEPAILPITGELMFTTPTEATLGSDGITLPAHAGVLMRLED
jgi:maltooligosyltrehalose trehalohydrolase